MLQDGRTAARLPAQDLERARRFYAEKLGLEPADERPGGLLYRCASGEFALYQSSGAPPGTLTQMGFEVDDIDATVATLKERGVIFEDVDVPGLKTIAGIADIEGQYPSKHATRERAAWFHDREGHPRGRGPPTKQSKKPAAPRGGGAPPHTPRPPQAPANP